MVRERILVADDEEDILGLVRYSLERDGFDVTCVNTGEDVLPGTRKFATSLIILDLMMPGLDGLSVMKLLKRDEAARHIPVIMLTARGTESDIVTGLELGADDYVTKPFSPRVLVARVRNVLRHRAAETGAAGPAVMHRGAMMIDPARREVAVDGQPVELTATEFAILIFLAARPGWVFTRDQIIEAVRGDNYPVTDRSVDVHISGLRRKLGPAGDAIGTVRGVGYRFRE